jgi:hypothetical protein
MRLFLGCMLAVALALSPAVAGTNDSRSGGSGDAKASDANSNSTSETAAKPDPSAEPAKGDTESELPAEAPAPSPASDSSSSVSSAPASPAGASTAASASLPASSSTSKKSSKSVAKGARPPATEPQNSGAEAAPSPLSFNIGSARFTPGGFVDLTNFFRSKDIGSGIGTTFSSVPYNNSLPLAALTEDHFSPQNSRLTLRVDSTVAGGSVLGYVETDFLGFTNDNLNVTSNSDTLRLRVYFVDYRKGKFEFLGGQDWSMLTPSRTGIAVMPADVFNTQDMDTNYQVGLPWERTPQFRLIFHPSNTLALGVSIENPQQYTGSGVTFPAFPLTFNTTQVNTGTSLNSTAIAASPANGVNTLATPDVAPDLIAKIAFDPHPPGHALHFEAMGLFRTFKIDTFTTTNVNLGTTTIHGGAGAFNSNYEIFKNFKIFETAFFSSGGGREIGNTNVPDFIVTPANTATSLLGLSPVRSDAGILGLEYQTTPKFMVYGYYGYVYVGRNFTPASAVSGCGTTAAPTACGYGGPGSSNTDDRSVDEPTIGFIPTFWRNPNYGALSLITQFSYLTRSPWVVAAGAPKDAHAFMAYVDLRYTLP